MAYAVDEVAKEITINISATELEYHQQQWGAMTLNDAVTANAIQKRQ